LAADFSSPSWPAAAGSCSSRHDACPTNAGCAARTSNRQATFVRNAGTKRRKPSARVAERADQQRAREEERQQQKEQAEREEEERLKKAQEEEDAKRRRQQEREREEARKREAEERRRQDEEARERRLAIAVSGGEFDPYEVLEVPHGASEDDIRAAYEVAKEKSDPSQVSHLSDEVQEHFRLKSKAVERAFQTLVK
jgi:hypothetical protein